MLSKNIFLWIIIVVAVVLVVWTFSNKEGGINLVGTPEVVSEGSGPEAGAPVISGPGQGSFTQSQIQAYSTLVNEYGDRRIQFDEGCQLRPAEVTFKNGTTIMFDNRSANARTIKVANQSYYFPPYGYRIMTLSSATVPSTLIIGCDNAPDVGRILLQAVILGE